MEQQPEEQLKSPYQDPQLIAAAQGDEQLLDRLVGAEIASQVLDQDPDNALLQQRLAIMEQAVSDRRQQLGISQPINEE